MRLLAALCLLVVILGPAQAREEEEYIVVSGGPALYQWEKFKRPPHDRWWGNLIRSAVARIQQLKDEHGADAKITWQVHRPSYQRRSRQKEGPLTTWIDKLGTKYGVKLVWFETTNQLINYLNAGEPRHLVKIGTLDWFLHSNKACFMFDYSSEIDSASKVWLHQNDLKQIRRGIFSRKAKVKSWGCHTGESMSKEWKRATGIRMVGAIGKTDYSEMHRNNWIPSLSPGGRWKR